MKRAFLCGLLLAVLGVSGLSAYSFEIAVGEGVEASYQWGLETPRGTGLAGRGVLWGSVGVPLPVGKLHLSVDGSLGIDVGVLGGVGWGGEWFLADWFSLEAAAMLKAGVFNTWYSPEPTLFAYAGLEPLARANLIPWGGPVVLGVAVGASVRWLQQTVVMAGVPVLVTVGLRF